MIDEMRDAEDQFRITYELRYSNYTFELWMLLHVADMSQAVLNRKAYLAPINRWFHRDFYKGKCPKLIILDRVTKDFQC